MFKKLKDKIAEEVKQSPARFQEIINSAQVSDLPFRQPKNKIKELKNKSNWSMSINSSVSRNLFVYFTKLGCSPTNTF